MKIMSNRRRIVAAAAAVVLISTASLVGERKWETLRRIAELYAVEKEALG